MLGPDTHAPPLKVFYSNNTPVPPPPASSCPPLAMASRVKDRVATVAAIARMAAAEAAVDRGHYCNAFGQGNKGQGSKPSPVPPSTTLRPGPLTCTLIRL
jgi:hypothetical protein